MKRTKRRVGAGLGQMSQGLCDTREKAEANAQKRGIEVETMFAGCGGQQSGQRFLDSSDPRLIRHVAPCETAGGDFSSLPAGKDEKLSREFEGGARNGRAAPVLSSLDSITNNRHSVPDYYQRPVGRGKHCGRYSIRGIDPKTGRTVHRRVNCGSWTCSYCGKRKARLAKNRIREEASRLNLCYFWTLTLAHPTSSPAANVRHIRIVFNHFREYLSRKHKKDSAPINFICVLEYTQRGVPHLHILLDRYIPQRWVSNIWSRLGGGRIVHVKRVTVHNIARYLSKYLTKDLLLSAPKGTRRITTSRSIKLFPKFNSGVTWEFLRESIWQLLVAHCAASFGSQPDLFRSILTHFDEEQFLKGFELVVDG